MPLCKPLVVLMAILVPCTAMTDQLPVTTTVADQLFQAGKFEQASVQYAQVAVDHPNDYHTSLQLGRIALLANRLSDAETWLQKAHALRPTETDPRVMLAEVYYRQDEFGKAAAALDGIDVSTNQLILTQYPTLNVPKLRSFSGQTPYEVHGSGQSTRIKLLQTDPIPLISVRVNGSQEVTFFIDTGGSEVALDSDFARELGLPTYGSMQGTFSGGQQTAVTHSRIDALALGDWTISNLPAVLLPLRQLSDIAGGRQINGLIGTTLFYHFLATLDLPHSELVLRKRSSVHEQPAANKGVAVPFWLAGDHFMVSWGQVQSQSPSLLFVDTGLIGAGVKLGEAMLKSANIQLEYDKATTGAGAGGTLTTVPYVVQQLSLGKVQEVNVPGLYDGPFPWEHLFGFYLAGMVGHDFFRPYALTLDFDKMEIRLNKSE